MASEQINPPRYRNRSSLVLNMRVLNLAFATLAMMVWSFWPSLCTMVAALRLQAVSEKIVTEGSDQGQLELQRDIQKHFLTYGIYIPLEDIFFTRKLTESNKDLEPALRRACGNNKNSDGRFALWLPLIVRIPLVGERSSEWCWNIASKRQG